MSVRMRHEGVQNAVDVAESAVPFHAAAGWVVDEDQEADGEPSGEQRKTGRPRARATTKDEGQD